MAPVAAEIIPGRPPTKAVITAIQNEAYSPTLGSTPAIIEKAIASGTSASATTRPASRSLRILPSQSARVEDNNMDKPSTAPRSPGGNRATEHVIHSGQGCRDRLPAKCCGSTTFSKEKGAGHRTKPPRGTPNTAGGAFYPGSVKTGRVAAIPSPPTLLTGARPSPG